MAPSCLRRSLGSGQTGEAQAHLGRLDEGSAGLKVRHPRASGHRARSSEAQGCRKHLILADGGTQRRGTSRRPNAACGASGKAGARAGRLSCAGARCSVSFGQVHANAPNILGEPWRTPLAVTALASIGSNHENDRERNHGHHHQAQKSRECNCFTWTSYAGRHLGKMRSESGIRPALPSHQRTRPRCPGEGLRARP